MADQVQLRRGTAAQVAAFTGAQSELVATTDTNRLVLNDGVTAGGHPHALQAELVVNVVDTGAANTIVVASNIGPTAPVDGMILSIKIAATSTTACTINYNSAGALPLVSGAGAALVPGALQAAAAILVIYRAALGAYLLLARDGGAAQFAAPVPISQGGTGASTAAGAVANLGLAEALTFGGTWNASTNTPTFASGTGAAGVVYNVSVAGSTTLDGISQWNVGDKAVFNGITNTWNKIDGNSNEVLSVAGRVGNVVLSITDIANGAALNAYQTYTKTQCATVQPLVYASTVTIDFTQGNDAAITLTGNVTFANPATLPAGASGAIEITQDSTGGRTASFGSSWKFGSGGTPALSTAAGAVDLLTYHITASGRLVAALVTGIT
jgi:hypothetical protein